MQEIVMAILVALQEERDRQAAEAAESGIQPA
jgi:hypothetical protein